MSPHFPLDRRHIATDHPWSLAPDCLYLRFFPVGVPGAVYGLGFTNRGRSIHMNRRLAGALMAAVVLTSCDGSGSDEAATETTTTTTEAERTTTTEAATTTTASTTSTTAAPTTTTTPPNELNQEFTEGGITLSLTAVTSAPTLRYEGGYMTSDNPSGDPREVPAPEGGRYVSVTASGKNNAKVGIDLTCGYPIQHKLLDDAGREYDAVDDLAEIAGNPGCNDSIQPGFMFTMTWVYLVPADAVIEGWSFGDSSESYVERPEVIRIIEPGR